MARDQPWGAITLIATDRAFDAADVDLAAELARRAAAAIETGRLVRSLERSEERYRLLFEANPLPMWVYDADTLRFLAVNDAAVRHYGYTSSEFLSMTITDIRPREDVDRAARRHAAARRPGLADTGYLAAPAEGRLADRRGDHRRQGRVRGPSGGARARPRRDRAPAARGAARPGGEDGGDRPPGRRRRARLQQPADGDLRLRRDPARATPTRGARAARARSPTRPSRRPRSPASCSRSAAARCCTRACSTSTTIVAGMEPMLRRIIGDDITSACGSAPASRPVEADRAQIEQ